MNRLKILKFIQAPYYTLCLLVIFLTGNELIICESNSLRRFIEPGYFMIMQRKGIEEIKPSCQAVWEYADCINDFEKHRFAVPVDSVIYNDPDWEVNESRI